MFALDHMTDPMQGCGWSIFPEGHTYTFLSFPCHLKSSHRRIMTNRIICIVEWCFPYRLSIIINTALPTSIYNGFNSFIVKERVLHNSMCVNKLQWNFVPGIIGNYSTNHMDHVYQYQTCYTLWYAKMILNWTWLLEIGCFWWVSQFDWIHLITFMEWAGSIVIIMQASSKCSHVSNMVPVLLVSWLDWSSQFNGIAKCNHWSSAFSIRLMISWPWI